MEEKKVITTNQSEQVIFCNGRFMLYDDFAKELLGEQKEKE